MISTPPLYRATLLAGVCLPMALPMKGRLDAAEAEVGQRDFSAEAEAAHHGDRLEALRDPELRRHYLDQMESRQRPELEKLWTGQAGPGPSSPQLPQQLPPEIRQLQQALGGPQVDRYSSLRTESAAGEPHRPPLSHPAVAAAGAIRALRDGAAKLDEIANRLEQLELYPQADALRQQAQRLRLDARGPAALAIPAEAAPRPTPAQWFDSGAPTLPEAGSPAPRLRPSRHPPELRPTPSAPIAPPALEPVPQPENPSDPPKPQPLLDSPEATPQPDVEVEG